MQPSLIVRTAHRARATIRPYLTQRRHTSEEKPPPPPEPPKVEHTCRYNYAPEIEIMINLQIQAENQAAQDYLGMALHFAHPNVARPGCHGFFMAMYEEEIGHMLALAQYQLTRGGVVHVGSVDAPPKSDQLSVIDAFKRALGMEHAVTERLEKLVAEAENIKDYQCSDYITSVFLQEQMNSIREISSHVTCLASFNNCCHAIYHYDLELLRQYPKRGRRSATKK